MASHLIRRQTVRDLRCRANPNQSTILNPPQRASCRELRGCTLKRIEDCGWRIVDCGLWIHPPTLLAFMRRNHPLKTRKRHQSTSLHPQSFWAPREQSFNRDAHSSILTGIHLWLRGHRKRLPAILVRAFLLGSALSAQGAVPSWGGGRRPPQLRCDGPSTSSKPKTSSQWGRGRRAGHVHISRRKNSSPWGQGLRLERGPPRGKTIPPPRVISRRSTTQRRTELPLEKGFRGTSV